MTLYSLSVLAIVVICFSLAVYVFYRNPRGNINKAFMYLSLAFATWCAEHFIYISLDSSSLAAQWERYFAIWIFIPSVITHFILIYVQKGHYLKKLPILLAVYGPGVFLYIYNVLTEKISGIPIETMTKTEWGWANAAEVVEYSLLQNSYILWGMILSIISIVLVVRYYRSVDMKIIRRQARVILMGYAVFVILALSAFFLRIINPFAPDLIPQVYGIFLMFIAYGIVTSNLFEIDYFSAVEHIVTIMPDSLFLLTPDFIVAEVNNATIGILKKKKEKIVGKNIETFINGKTNFKQQLQMGFRKDDTILDIEATLKEDSIPMSVSARRISDKDNRTLGYALIGRNIEERKKSLDELEKKTRELERINKLLVGRELEMVKLKRQLGTKKEKK